MAVYALAVPLQSTYGLTALLECSMELRTVAAGARSLEEAGGHIVAFLRDHFADKVTGESALPLVRMYATQRTDQLTPELRDYALAAGSDARSGPDVQCLTLLATAGEEERWNDRRQSVGHKAIPLPSVESIRRMPMVARLIDQMGIDARHVVDPDPALFHHLGEKSFNVLYVADAREHPSVPAQADFVIPYGIRSMIGFGGVLPDGMFVVIVLFSRVVHPAERRRRLRRRRAQRQARSAPAARRSGIRGPADSSPHRARAGRTH